MEAKRRNKPSISIKALLVFWSSANGNKIKNKISISPISKFNGNNILLIRNPEKFKCSIEVGQGRRKGIFQGFLTLLASFDFATSCPKIKVWCMRSNRILFL